MLLTDVSSPWPCADSTRSIKEARYPVSQLFTAVQSPQLNNNNRLDLYCTFLDTQSAYRVYPFTPHSYLVMQNYYVATAVLGQADRSTAASVCLRSPLTIQFNSVYLYSANSQRTLFQSYRDEKHKHKNRRWASRHFYGERNIINSSNNY